MDHFVKNGIKKSHDDTLSSYDFKYYSSNALCEAFTRPCLSISVILTSIVSPIFNTSSTFSILFLKFVKCEATHLYPGIGLQTHRIFSIRLTVA